MKSVLLMTSGKAAAKLLLRFFQIVGKDKDDKVVFHSFFFV